MNFDMINTWLNDFSNWGKIFGGLAKLVDADINGALSAALDWFQTPEEDGEKSAISTAFETLSTNLSTDFGSSK